MRKPSATIDPGYLAQLKLRALALVQQRDSQQAQLHKTLAELEQIEGVWGDSIDRLMVDWGYAP